VDDAIADGEASAEIESIAEDVMEPNDTILKKALEVVIGLDRFRIRGLPWRLFRRKTRGSRVR
jgi:hypothetical protein